MKGIFASPLVLFILLMFVFTLDARKELRNDPQIDGSSLVKAAQQNLDPKGPVADFHDTSYNGDSEEDRSLPLNNFKPKDSTSINLEKDSLSALKDFKPKEMPNLFLYFKHSNAGDINEKDSLSALKDFKPKEMPNVFYYFKSSNAGDINEKDSLSALKNLKPKEMPNFYPYFQYRNAGDIEKDKLSAVKDFTKPKDPTLNEHTDENSNSEKSHGNGNGEIDPRAAI